MEKMTGNVQIEGSFGYITYPKKGTVDIGKVKGQSWECLWLRGSELKKALALELGDEKVLNPRAGEMDQVHAEARRLKKVGEVITLTFSYADGDGPVSVNFPRSFLENVLDKLAEDVNQAASVEKPVRRARGEASSRSETSSRKTGVRQRSRAEV